MILTLTESPDPPPVESRPYGARGAALALWRSRANEVLIEGPAGTGKTRAVLEKVLWLCGAYPGSRHLLLRQTRASMTQSALVTWEDKVLPAGLVTNGDASRGHRSSYMVYGSEVVTGGLDNPDRIMSTEYDTISVFEATEITEEAWEKLLTRLRNNIIPYQQAIADTNPGPPGHWLNQRAGRGRMVRLLSRHEDNHSITPEYLDVLRGLTGHRRARLYEGRWVAGEGTVYPEFQEARHVMRPFVPPAEWPMYVGIDPGFDHPCAILWLTTAPNGCAYVIDELYRGGLGVQQHAADIRARNKGRTVLRYYGDPQHAFSCTAQSPKSIATQFRECGISLVPWPRTAGKEESMVEAVRKRLTTDRLKVFGTCVNTIREFQSWSYKRTSKGELPPGEDKFEDRDNHAMDCIKGLVATGLRHEPLRFRVHDQRITQHERIPSP